MCAFMKAEDVTVNTAMSARSLAGILEDMFGGPMFARCLTRAETGKQILVPDVLNTKAGMADFDLVIFTWEQCLSTSKQSLSSLSSHPLMRASSALCPLRYQ